MIIQKITFTQDYFLFPINLSTIIPVATQALRLSAPPNRGMVIL